MPVAGRLLTHLGHQDDRLLMRCALPSGAPALWRQAWMGLTQLGGATITISALALPLALGGTPTRTEWRAAAALVGSHLVVQLIKRSVQRDRPARDALIPCPDRFSFPSGHATASFAVALGYAEMLPSLSVPLMLIGVIVGWSRVVLGVHYPGDVVMGQIIAWSTMLLVRGLT